MGWKGDSPVTVEEPATVKMVNDEIELFVQHNARDHEVFVSHNEDSYDGISIFTGIACRELAMVLMDAAEWLDTLPPEEPITDD
jgi:hypothetical protein